MDPDDQARRFKNRRVIADVAERDHVFGETLLRWFGVPAAHGQGDVLHEGRGPAKAKRQRFIVQTL